MFSIPMLDPPPPPDASPPAISDDELMSMLATTGAHESAFSELRTRHCVPIFRRHFAMTGDHAAADELTEETFCRLYFKRHLYRPGGPFQGWLHAVAKSVALNYLRNRDRHPRPMSSLPSGKEDPEAEPLGGLDDGRVHREPEEREFARLLQQAVEELPLPQRQAFDVCVLQGMTYKESATTLGVPQGTVAVHVMRARRSLASSLAAVLYPPHHRPPCPRPAGRGWDR